MVDIRRFHEFLLVSQWGERQAILDWQRDQLEPLLRHARDTVPFYHFRLARLFRPDGRIDWEKWAEVPVLRRQDLQQHESRLQSRRPIAEHGHAGFMSSSGSTGVPVRCRPTELMLRLTAACSWRSFAWHGIDWSKDVLAVSYVPQQGRKPGDRTGIWGPNWDKRAQKGASLYAPGDFTPREVYALLRQVRATYVSTAAQICAEMARFNRESGDPLPLGAMFSRGAAMTESHVEAVREGFGAKLIDLYSAKEAGSIAHRCPEADTWHLNEEALLVEILDKDGQPCAPGVTGRVVVTPFGCTAMPLIRYELGDMAAFGAPCSCGRSLKTMSELQGRVSQMFSHPVTGDFLSWYPAAKLQKGLGLERWQVVQTGPSLFEVRVEETEPFAEERVAQFQAEFRAALYPEAEAHFVHGADLSLRPGGKFLEYKNEWRPG